MGIFSSAKSSTYSTNQQFTTDQRTAGAEGSTVLGPGAVFNQTTDTGKVLDAFGDLVRSSTAINLATLETAQGYAGIAQGISADSVRALADTKAREFNASPELERAAGQIGTALVAGLLIWAITRGGR